MNPVVGYVAGAVIALAALVYLVAAMLFAERF